MKWLRNSLKVIATLGILLTFGCRNCPKETTPPPQVITVTKPCMDPWPVIDIPKWPEKTGEVYIITEEMAAKFSLVLGTLITYILAQQAKCLKNE